MTDEITQDEMPILTPREVEITLALADGDSTEAIADALSLSTHTIRTHIKNAMRKCEAVSRTQLVAMVLREQVKVRVFGELEAARVPTCVESRVLELDGAQIHSLGEAARTFRKQAYSDIDIEPVEDTLLSLPGNGEADESRRYAVIVKQLHPEPVAA